MPRQVVVNAHFPPPVPPPIIPMQPTQVFQDIGRIFDKIIDKANRRPPSNNMTLEYLSPKSDLNNFLPMMTIDQKKRLLSIMREVESQVVLFNTALNFFTQPWGGDVNWNITSTDLVINLYPTSASLSHLQSLNNDCYENVVGF